MVAVLIITLLTLLCVRAAQLMAAGANRPAKFWMGLAALSGPVALVALALLPRKSAHH